MGENGGGGGVAETLGWERHSSTTPTHTPSPLLQSYGDPYSSVTLNRPAEHEAAAARSTARKAFANG